MMPAFDCHHSVHDAEHSLVPRRGKESRAPAEEETLLEAMLAAHFELMDNAGVQWAALHAPIVYQRYSGLADTRAVNDWVAAYRDRAPDRFPASFGTVEPLYCEDGLPEVDRCLRDLGMTGLGFHPRFQAVSTESYWILRYVERIVEGGGLPVLRAMGETPEEMLWKVAHVARTFPEARILVLDMFATYEALAEAFDMAGDCPNLYWSTSLAYDWDMVEPLARFLGFDRVLFGSDLHRALPPPPSSGKDPDRLVYPGGMAAPRRVSHVLPQLCGSELSADEKALVAWKSAARLFDLDLEPGAARLSS